MVPKRNASMQTLYRRPLGGKNYSSWPPEAIPYHTKKEMTKLPGIDPGPSDMGDVSMVAEFIYGWYQFVHQVEKGTTGG